MGTEIPQVELVCDKCHQSYSISKYTQQRRLKDGTPNYCKSCMKEYLRDLQKNYFNNLSEEEKKIFIEKRNWHARASAEEKERYSKKMKAIYDAKTPEQLEEERRKNSEGLKRHWQTVTQEDKDKRLANMHIGTRKRWDSMTPEERSKKASDTYWNLPEERRKELHDIYSANARKYNASLTREEQLERAKAMQEWHANLTPEEKKAFYKKTHQWVYDMTPLEKSELAQSKRDWWNNLSDEEREEYARKRAIQQPHRNALVKRFEKAFQESSASAQYHLVWEDVQQNETMHIWDCGIYDDANHLVMVVDLDSARYHGTKSDYDGSASREDIDEKRSQSVPDGVKIAIIDEPVFDETFAMMVSFLDMSYDTYVDTLFDMYRKMPFPDLVSTTTALQKSYDALVTMDCDDNYHQSMSINTRIGDTLIYHFHPSIYRAHCKDKLSPHEAWTNDSILKQSIQDKFLYYTYLNPRKILQGFNISDTAPRVSVFSAAKAKMIINRYLNQFDTVFDPFSGFSGRMLGTVSMGKRYIGQDVSEIAVNESNQMIEFLQPRGIQAEVHCANVLESRGSYPCLFTCPPYSDKEQWVEVPVDTRSCDDWIDVCLNNFDCKRYVFVVDETTKYKAKIVDMIFNRSYRSPGYEHIVVIDK